MEVRTKYDILDTISDERVAFFSGIQHRFHCDLIFSETGAETKFHDEREKNPSRSGLWLEWRNGMLALTYVCFERRLYFLGTKSLSIHGFTHPCLAGNT